MTALLRVLTRAPTESAVASAVTMGSTGESPMGRDPRQKVPHGPAAAPRPDPEDDEFGRGVPRFGPALLVGVLVWVAVVVLLLV